MKKVILIIAILTSIIFNGCTIKREVHPIEKILTNDICIIENRAVKDSFLTAYINSLEEIGYMVKVLPARSPINSCVLSSTYTANWQWDLAMYLSYVKIDVYDDSKLIGTALYDSKDGGGRVFDKFVDGEKLVKSLVNELYLVK